MKKKEAKQLEALATRAYAVLDETALPWLVFFPTLGFVRISNEMDGQNFVILQEGTNIIYSNTALRHASAIVEDMAECMITSRSKILEKNIEDTLDKDKWQGEDGDTK